MNWFLLLKYIHVMLAITAVGTNITYAAWGARAKRAPEHLGFALRGIKFLDDRVANPCYGLLLATGLIMAGTHYTFTTRFVEIAIGLWVLLVIVAAALYSPTLRKQIDALNAGGAESDIFQQLDRKATAVGIPLAIVALLIVLDMVVKPGL